MYGCMYVYSWLIYLGIFQFLRTPLDDLCKYKDDLLSFCRNISAGLDHLYRKRFVHRDLAARNILLSNDRVCKVRRNVVPCRGLV